MSTVLLEHLIDDAALFPPAEAPMATAVGGHRAVKVGPLGWLVGRFLCPATRIGEMLGELRRDEAFALGLIADSGVPGLPGALAEVAAEPRLVLLAVEIRVAAEPDVVAAVRDAVAVLPTGPRCYVEVPRGEGWRTALAVVGAAGHGAKLRMGGPRAEAFPTEDEVADFVNACVATEIPFKCTAGLHNAVRHTDPETGFEHHGFLNVALAVAAAVRGDDPQPVLAERDPERVAAAVRELDDATAERARALYAGHGSCSLGEPAGDLLTMGLLDGGFD